MKLDRVTITGADDSVKPSELADLSAEFPFVEWAILFSPKHQGFPRWPSSVWLMELHGISATMNLSAHLCGWWVRDVLRGNFTFTDWVTVIDIFDDYQRVQLNFHAKPTSALFPELPIAIRKESMCRHGSVERQFIFQIDGVNNHLLDSVRRHGQSINCVPLFDGSHGAGVVPKGWPKPESVPTIRRDDRSIQYPLYFGYAGGLGPETLETQLPLIAEAAGDARIWIDMERRVRSDDDRVFDLAKVRRCLEICQPWITV